MRPPGSPISASGSSAPISSPSSGDSPPTSCPPSARDGDGRSQHTMTLTVRFDPAAPYEVEEADVPFARPDSKELLARIYRPKGEASRPLAALVDVHGGAWSRGDRTTAALD